MVTNDSREQTKGEFRCKLKEADCHPRVTEPYSPWQQAAEGCIHELKRGSSRKIIKTGSPKCLWDQCLELEAYVCSYTSNDIYMTTGQVPETIMTGNTTNISHIAEFGWYNWVMFCDNKPSYPDDKLILGHYLGPAIDTGSALMAKILKLNGVFVCRSTLWHLTDEELSSSVHKDMRRKFDESIEQYLGPVALPQDFLAEDLSPDPSYFDDTNAVDPEYGDTEITPKIGENYLSTELMLPMGGVMVKGRVTACKHYRDGNPVGHANDNPILDTRSYIANFDYGNQTELTANMIAESLSSQCDPDGNQYVLLEEIVDHQCLPAAVNLSDQKIAHDDGETYLKHSTIGWQLCCQWKHGSTSLENLLTLRSLTLLKLKYAKMLGIDHAPDFNWWAPHVLRKRDSIISLVRKWNPCYLKRTHKFGIELPMTVKEALELDKKNGSIFWVDAIDKMMKGICIAFKILLDG
jgi:hypothetical protein